MKLYSMLATGALAISTLLFSPLVFAHDDAHAKKELVPAEVKKVDKEAGKVTLKHSEIKSLDMPAMTMVFKVKDDKLWDKLTEGAKVKFSVEKGFLTGYTVTHVEADK
jgi:Cu(I)/Ag(I) efflux system periplasmic protein CusF